MHRIAQQMASEQGGQLVANDATLREVASRLATELAELEASHLFLALAEYQAPVDPSERTCSVIGGGGWCHQSRKHEQF